MLVGLDLDNTIINYDAALARVGSRLGILPAGFVGSKLDVRRYLWALPDGDLLWQRLQAEIYGPSIHEAELSTGVRGFIERCRANDVDLVIVSHKSEFAAADPDGSSLRVSAIDWLRERGIIGENHYAIPLDAVVFTSTRREKIFRIHALECSYFVDDLEEVLLDPTFPKTTVGLLFRPVAVEGDLQAFDLTVCRSWDDVWNRVFAVTAEQKL